jgi:hypothetical protein
VIVADHVELKGTLDRFHSYHSQHIVPVLNGSEECQGGYSSCHQITYVKAAEVLYHPYCAAVSR